jgi:hypothetical protein
MNIIVPLAWPDQWRHAPLRPAKHTVSEAAELGLRRAYIDRRNVYYWEPSATILNAKLGDMEAAEQNFVPDHSRHLSAARLLRPDIRFSRRRHRDHLWISSTRIAGLSDTMSPCLTGQIVAQYFELGERG